MDRYRILPVFRNLPVLFRGLDFGAEADSENLDFLMGKPERSRGIPMRTSCLIIAASTVLIAALSGGAPAAEVKVLSAVGMRRVLDDLGPKFESATGHRLTITFDASGSVVKRIEAGESFDVAMVLRPLLERLVQEGKVKAGSTADLASSIAAVAVRQGAPKPDISSPEAFKRTR